MNIAVTGANGLVGSRIIELLKSKHSFMPFSSKNLDITQKDIVQQVLGATEFDLLLHLAAYTNVDGAETEKEKAHTINVEGTRNLLEQVEKAGKKMIYISTDFVFDGRIPPFDEMSTPNPVGYYGQTKYEAEQIVKDKAMIVRISYPYGYPSDKKPDFVQRLRQLLELNKPITMISDSAMTPTFIDDIAQGLDYLCNNFKPETFHLVGAKSYTPLEVGKLIAKQYGLPEHLIQPITFAEYMKGKAQRPQYSIIMTSKNTFHPMRTFEEGLQQISTQ